MACVRSKLASLLGTDTSRLIFIFAGKKWTDDATLEDLEVGAWGSTIHAVPGLDGDETGGGEGGSCSGGGEGGGVSGGGGDGGGDGRG